ncbi:acyltransferase family protein [Pseudomonas sp. B14(2022)]|uniref:acyltransferase family protein n=1 Tax=Pseudomonas sp. B14(2022) TaxID=2914043 RepID=UPI001430A9DA|nr:acyltransferase [Pseudomonas sp. B14(2022)]NJJ60290.1 acyltransferase [Pseudomonas sp. B14(2022)]
MTSISTSQSRQLDSLRGVSALIVLVGHAHQAFLRPTFPESSVYVGFFTQFSVMVFFVLSGFLIGKSIFSNISANGEFNILKYARDRFIRLYPPLIASMLLMVALVILAPYVFSSGTNSYLHIPGVNFIREVFTTNSKQIYGPLLFINGFKTPAPSANGPLWSLSIEAWYYVLAAAIFLWPSNKIWASLVVALTVAVTYKNPMFFILMPIWFAGLGLSFIHRQRPQMNNNLFSALFVLFGAGTIYCIYLVLAQKHAATSILQDGMTHFMIVSGLWFASFLALIMGQGAKFTTLFSSTASFSYTLYIIHFPIILFVVGMTQKLFIGSLSNALLVSVITMASAIATSIFLSKIVENKKLIESFISQQLRHVKRLTKAS